MKFEKITYKGLQKSIEVFEFDDVEHLKRLLYNLFYSNENVARYEELKMKNGRYSYSLKDRSNKIILQYKTIA